MKRNVKMKILIAVVFTILILGLIAGFFMNRRGDGEVRSAYDYTKVTTVTATKKAPKTTKKATTTTTLKKNQKKVTIPGTYVPIMNKYQEALSKKWSNQTCLQNGVSNVLPELYEGTPLENVGFWVGDYNGDGTTDLIIGVVDGYQHYPYAILDAKLQWDTSRYQLYVQASNLTNHRYRDLGPVPQPGLWVMAGAKVKMEIGNRKRR